MTTPTREQVIEWLIASGFPNMICDNLTEQDHQRMSSFATIAYSAGRDQGLREAKEVCEAIDPRASSNPAMLCAMKIKQLRGK